MTLIAVGKSQEKTVPNYNQIMHEKCVCVCVIVCALLQEHISPKTNTSPQKSERELGPHFWKKKGKPIFTP